MKLRISQKRISMNYRSPHICHSSHLARRQPLTQTMRMTRTICLNQRMNHRKNFLRYQWGYWVWDQVSVSIPTIILVCLFFFGEIYKYGNLNFRKIKFNITGESQGRKKRLFWEGWYWKQESYRLLAFAGVPIWCLQHRWLRIGRRSWKQESLLQWGNGDN